jgi:hypothetical protein
MTFKHGIVEVREARIEDCAALAPNLRLEDSIEVRRSGFQKNEAALVYGLEHSTEASTVLIDGKPAAMFGLNAKTLLGAEAVIWFLGSPEMERIKKTFLRLSRFQIRSWRERYPVLYNLVPLEYEKSLKWLRWLGVNVDKRVTVAGHEWQLMAFAREA